MDHLCLIHWIEDAGLKYNVQPSATIDWDGCLQETAIKEKKVLKAKWYPYGIAKNHKGTYSCVVLGSGRKYLFSGQCLDYLGLSPPPQ
jgi:hypothetical protein